MSLSPNKILIADDDELIRDFLKDLCSLYGLSTKCVTNGQEAVAALEEDSFKIVFMDLDMPIMGGFQAAQVIRESEREGNRKRTPIISISGTTIDHPYKTCLEAGMDGFIPKPIVISDVFGIIKSLIEPQECGDWNDHTHRI